MTATVKHQVVRLSKDGLSHANSARLVGCSKSTITKFLKRFVDSKSIENKHRSGRPRITSVQGDRTLIRLIKKDRRQSLKDLTKEFNNSIPEHVSKRTVQRKLHSQRFKRQSVSKQLTISERNQKMRVKWCRECIHWTVNQNWKSVIFSDEMQFVLGKDSRVYVWRKPEEKWRPECLGLRSARNGGVRVSAMFWGCVCYNGVGTLTAVEGNMNKDKYLAVLDSQLWQVVAKHCSDAPWIFQDDNAPIHMSTRALEWKTENNIPSLPGHRSHQT